MHKLCFAAGCLLILGQALARGDTIYDSFGPGDSYNSGSGISILGSGATHGPQSAAASFTITRLTDVTSATFGIFDVLDVPSDPIADVDLTLSASLGGVALDSFVLVPSTTSGSTVSISINQLLPAGTYWFALSAHSLNDDSAAWYDKNSDVNASTTVMLNHGTDLGTGWFQDSSDQPAFSVSAAPLPSPIYGGLALLGALCAGSFLKRGISPNPTKIRGEH